MSDSRDSDDPARIRRRRSSLAAGAAGVFALAFAASALRLATSDLRPRPGLLPGVCALATGALMLLVAQRLRRGAAPWFVPSAPGGARPRFRAFPVTLLLWMAGLAGIVCAFLALGSPLRAGGQG